MEILIYILIAVVALIVGWLLASTIASKKYNDAIKQWQEKINSLEVDYATYKSQSGFEKSFNQRQLEEKELALTSLQNNYQQHQQKLSDAERVLATLQANELAAKQAAQGFADELHAIKQLLKQETESHTSSQRLLAAANADNAAMRHALQTQKQELEQMGEQIKTQFQNIANEILENKTNKFTELNKSNMQHILAPLGEDIKAFKDKVETAYGQESRERHTLKHELQNLAQLNTQLHKEANNLVKALKTEVKTQGRWGEMLLEKILEKSSLRKNEEYFLEAQLIGADGKPLISQMTGKKMRPDALILYTDGRHVIVDAKVSINAYVRSTETEDEAEKEAQLLAHVKAMKKHIDDLQLRAYEDFSKSMDFVMMFVPLESAYIAAVTTDPNLWEYAYDRRVLLVSPTHFITALKLIEDLWRREENNKNADKIAERAQKMYEKMVGFVESLDAVGKNLDQAKDRYTEAVKQLHTGRDNFFGQAGKLRDLIKYDNKKKDFDQARLDFGADAQQRAEMEEGEE